MSIKFVLNCGLNYIQKQVTIILTSSRYLWFPC